MQTISKSEYLNRIHGRYKRRSVCSRLISLVGTGYFAAHYECATHRYIFVITSQTQMEQIRLYTLPYQTYEHLYHDLCVFFSEVWFKCCTAGLRDKDLKDDRLKCSISFPLTRGEYRTQSYIRGVTNC